jgi:hypothetical protein
VAQKVGARLGQREILLSEVQGLMAGFERIVYVPFDHLNFERGASVRKKCSKV